MIWGLSTIALVGLLSVLLLDLALGKDDQP